MKRVMTWMAGALALALAFSTLPACKKNKAKAPAARSTAKKGKTPARAAARTPAKATKAAAATGKVKDYVCGMTIDAKTAPHKHTHKGHTYYFCNKGCFEKFKKTPDKYAALRAKDAKK